MLRYPCLVLDHDDTVVQSEATINYPFFEETLSRWHPELRTSLQDYIRGCCDLGFTEMCRQWYQFTDDELDLEYRLWQKYISCHIPNPFPGIRELILEQKSNGGYICVVSHSSQSNISRDYQQHFGIAPDAIYGWDFPPEQRKPFPFPLEDIMQRFSLNAKDLLVVDDMKPAWEMAQKVGVDTAFAAWGRLDYPKILSEMRSICTYHFDSPAQLRNFLFQSNETETILDF